MREIKFRVWMGSAMDHKIMAGFLGAFFVQGMDEYDSACMSEFNTKYPDNAPVMQYTGLKDSKGREIYEGDIVRYSETVPSLNQAQRLIQGADYVLIDKIGHVMWDEEGADFEIVMGDIERGFDARGDYNIEVIGNIYENPELLEVKP